MGLKYDKPYNKQEILDNYGKEVCDKLMKDPAHKFRANTGIELIHKEPTKEELERIWINWNLMDDEQKKLSDKESIRLFGKNNMEHYNELINLYENWQMQIYTEQSQSPNKANIKVILTELYPMVDSRFKGSGTMTKYKKILSSFIEFRHSSLYDNCPCDRMVFSDKDKAELFDALGISQKEVENILSKTYYADIAAFNPAAAKDAFTVLQLSIVRYFFLKKDTKNLELSLIYLSFSGKFYPSIHSGSFPYLPARHVMEYVVNNMMSNKYDLVTKGSVLGAVKSVANTWLETYGDRLKDYDDEDVVYLIQQLHNRIKSFMKNVATLYYEANESGNVYITYDSDNLAEDGYRLADNDSLKMERIIENATNYINNNTVDYIACKRSSDNNVKTDEVKSIIESIVSNPDNVDEIKELIRCIVTSYFKDGKEKDVRNVEFISFSIASKPNTKDPLVLRQKEIITGWLETNSVNYKRRKSRLSTQISYNKCILQYFVLIIHQANK